MRRFFFYSYAVLLSLGLAHGFRKNVVVENFTATWCAYCPYQAQAISQLESVYGESLVVIKYHPSTSDPFYHSHSVTRLNYYAVPGYPTSLIQGNKAVVGGWNGVYSPLESYVVSSFAGESPCSLYVEIGEYNTSTLQAQVKVKVFMTSNQSLPIPSQLKLRVAILEDSIMYNWQNMNVLRYVVRGMWPNAAGTPLSLGYGDSAVYTFVMNVSDFLRAPYYYIAAFVQSDSTYSIRDYSDSYNLVAGNILQASKARLRVNYGNVGMVFRGLIDFNGNRRLERNENGVIRLGFSSNTPFSTAHDVNISISSLDPYLTVQTGSFYLDSIQIGDTVEIGVNVTALNFPEPHISKLVVNYSWDGILSRVDTVRLKLGVDTVLVWDGSYNAGVASNIRIYVDSLGFVYEWQSEADSGKPYIYPEYRTVLYVSGQVMPDTSVINRLKAVISSGKNLIISSQNLGERANIVDPDFLNLTLGVSFLSPNTSDRKLMGTGNMFSLSDSAIIGGSGSYANQNSKDVIEVIGGSGSLPILFYRTLSGNDVDSVAGIYKISPSGSRIIYLAFGIEGVGNITGYMTKRDFMTKLFEGVSNVREATFAKGCDTQVLRYGSFIKLPAGVSKMKIYSIDGRIARAFPEVPSSIMIDLSPGLYYLTFEKEGSLIKRRILITK